MASETACTYACLILHDDEIPITSDKIATLVKAAGVNVESYWSSLFAKLCEKKDIEDLLLNVGVGGGGAAPAAVAVPATGSGDASSTAGPVAEEKKEELKEESDDEAMFSLFD